MSSATLPVNRCAVATSLPPREWIAGACHTTTRVGLPGHNHVMTDPHARTPNARTGDLETALRTTAAIREFTDRPVTRDELARILDVARFAPSGGNQQAWHVVSVEEPAIRARIGELIVASAKEYLALARVGHAAVRAHGRRALARSRCGRPRCGARGAPRRRRSSPPSPTRPCSWRCWSISHNSRRWTPSSTGTASWPAPRSTPSAATSCSPRDSSASAACSRRSPCGASPKPSPRSTRPEGWALAAVIALGEPVHQPTRLRRNPVSDFATVDTFSGASLTTPS